MITALHEQVAHGTQNQATAEAGRNKSEPSKSANAVATADVTVDVETGKTGDVVKFSKIDDDDWVTYMFRHITGMLYKRALYFLRLAC